MGKLNPPQTLAREKFVEKLEEKGGVQKRGKGGRPNQKNHKKKNQG